MLTTTDISLHFEGVAALDHVSIEVRQGEIVAVIGPNGAGKSSLLDVITGLTPPDKGRVVLLGADITDAATHLRAAAGLGRSFQRGSLFPALTVTETVMLGLNRTSPIRLMEALAGAPWVAHDDRALRDRARVIVGEYGLDPWADVPIAELSTGLRRVCDLALQVARSPRVLLLDEPAAGLSSREAEALGPTLDRIRTTLEIPILLVEHDIALVSAVADRVYAMAAGRVITQGPAAEVLGDERVIAEYLGTPISLSAKR